MSELRQRKKEDPETSSDHNSKGADRRGEYIKNAALHAPQSIQPLIAQATPALIVAWDLVEKALPLAALCWAKAAAAYELLKPYNPEDLAPVFVGLIMVFFGGSFPTLIATVVAVRETSAHLTITKAFTDIYLESKAVLKESAKDNLRDENNDGIPDVQQIPVSSVLQRKMLLVVKTADPEKVTLALTALSAGALAVVASLKLTFARTLALGSSLGSTLNKPASRYFTPIMKGAFSEEYHKWIAPIIAYSCKMVAMSVAFWVQRVITAVHSAVQGGQLFTAGACRYLHKNRVISFDPDTSNLDEQAGYAVAVVGLYFQLTYTVPFLFSFLLLPFTILEWLIRLVISFA
jgi:hypothetical protein